MTIEEVVKDVMVREHGDLLRAAVEAICAQLMEGEVSELVDVERGSAGPMTGPRIATGIGRSGGTRRRVRSTADPQDPPGQLLPELLEAAPALEAGVAGGGAAGLRVRRLDAPGRPAREEPRLTDLQERGQPHCSALGEHVDAFRTRPLEGRYPYLLLEAKMEKVRAGGRVVNKALVIAHGVHGTGRREILSIDVGEAETEALWTAFLRGLGRAWPGWRPTRHQRRARRPEGRDREGSWAAPAALHGPLPQRRAGRIPSGLSSRRFNRRSQR
jgi:transposase-like protein